MPEGHNMGRVDIPENHPTRFPVITLCGSGQFRDLFHTWNSRLTGEGNVVLSIGSFKPGHPYHIERYWEPRKPMLDRIHLQKIDMSDQIFVIDPGFYIGESTSLEISYALDHGKLVRYLSFEDAACEICRRDNGNGTHDALQMTGHLNHSFTMPEVPIMHPSRWVR